MDMIYYRSVVLKKIFRNALSSFRDKLETARNQSFGDLMQREFIRIQRRSILTNNETDPGI